MDKGYEIAPEELYDSAAQRIKEIIESASNEESSITHVVGPPGSGKTTLLNRMLELHKERYATGHLDLNILQENKLIPTMVSLYNTLATKGAGSVEFSGFEAMCYLFRKKIKVQPKRKRTTILNTMNWEGLFEGIKEFTDVQSDEINEIRKIVVENVKKVSQKISGAFSIVGAFAQVREHIKNKKNVWKIKRKISNFSKNASQENMEILFKSVYKNDLREFLKKNEVAFIIFIDSCEYWNLINAHFFRDLSSLLGQRGIHQVIFTSEFDEDGIEKIEIRPNEKKMYDCLEEWKRERTNTENAGKAIDAIVKKYHFLPAVFFHCLEHWEDENQPASDSDEEKAMQEKLYQDHYMRYFSEDEKELIRALACFDFFNEEITEKLATELGKDRLGAELLLGKMRQYKLCAHDLGGGFYTLSGGMREVFQTDLKKGKILAGIQKIKTRIFEDCNFENINIAYKELQRRTSESLFGSAETADEASERASQLRGVVISAFLSFGKDIADGKDPNEDICEFSEWFILAERRLTELKLISLKIDVLITFIKMSKDIGTPIDDDNSRFRGDKGFRLQLQARYDLAYSYKYQGQYLKARGEMENLSVFISYILRLTDEEKIGSPEERKWISKFKIDVLRACGEIAGSLGERDKANETFQRIHREIPHDVEVSNRQKAVLYNSEAYTAIMRKKYKQAEECLQKAYESRKRDRAEEWEKRIKQAEELQKNPGNEKEKEIDKLREDARKKMVPYDEALFEKMWVATERYRNDIYNNRSSREGDFKKKYVRHFLVIYSNYSKLYFVQALATKDQEEFRSFFEKAERYYKKEMKATHERVEQKRYDSVEHATRAIRAPALKLLHAMGKMRALGEIATSAKVKDVIKELQQGINEMKKFGQKQLEVAILSATNNLAIAYCFNEDVPEANRIISQCVKDKGRRSRTSESFKLSSQNQEIIAKIMGADASERFALLQELIIEY